MKKQLSPPADGNPLQSYLLTELIKMKRQQRLEIAAAMLPYLDPPAPPGPWSIAFKNWLNIRWINEEMDKQPQLKFAG
jgi:hypothetical protein